MDVAHLAVACSWLRYPPDALAGEIVRITETYRGFGNLRTSAKGQARHRRGGDLAKRLG